MADAIVGHEGRVTVGGSNFTANHFKVKADATKVPANDYESRHRKSKAGLLGSEIEVSGYWDRDSNMVTVHSIKAGAQNLACVGYLIKGGLAFTFTAINIFTVEVTSEVDGAVEYTWTAETNGAWTYPGGGSAIP